MLIIKSAYFVAACGQLIKTLAPWSYSLVVYLNDASAIRCLKHGSFQTPRFQHVCRGKKAEFPVWIRSIYGAPVVGRLFDLATPPSAYIDLACTHRIKLSSTQINGSDAACVHIEKPQHSNNRAERRGGSAGHLRVFSAPTSKLTLTNETSSYLHFATNTCLPDCHAATGFSRPRANRPTVIFIACRVLVKV